MNKHALENDGVCSIDTGLLFDCELLSVGGAATGSLDASFCTNQRAQACKLRVLAAYILYSLLQVCY